MTLGQLAGLAAANVAGAVIAAVWLRRAWRGRRVGDHPVCRRCEYDLYGVPGVAVCPECGADVGGPGAVVAGGARRRRPRVALAAAVALVGLVVGLVLTWREAGRAWEVDANRPTWWLVGRLADARPAERDRAFAELARRQGAGTLTAGQVASAAERLIAIQGDRAVPWNAGWGDFVEAGREAGAVPDGPWATYARQAPVLELRNRQTVRRGEPMPLYIGVGPSRVGRGQALQVRYTARFRVGGQALSGQPWAGANDLSAFGAGGRFDRLDLPAEVLAALADGPQSLEADFEVEAFDKSGQSAAKWALAERRPWALVAAGAATVEVVRSAQLDAEVARALGARSVLYQPDGFVWVPLEVGPGMSADLAVDVSFRAGGQTWPAGRATMLVKHSGTTAGSARDLPATFRELRTVDVVLRGSADAARGTVEMTRVWGGEVVIPGVPVEVINDDTYGPPRDYPRLAATRPAER
ncbi:MAG TPA: hypothetical protein VEA69_06900 [Tepidisphaeraceae bacterium]|nr:hypothetical protein [Tepidisphaeraceae bacterium]